LNEWQHVVASVDDSGLMKLYRNGELRGALLGHLPQAISRTRQYVGKSNWGGNLEFLGMIDDLRVYDRAITQNEVEQIYGGDLQQYLVLGGEDPTVTIFWGDEKPENDYNSNRPVASYSVSFDGIDDYIDTGSTFESTFQSDFSISIWFRQNVINGAMALFGERNLTSSLKNFVRTYYLSNHISFDHSSNGSRNISSFGFTPDANWHNYIQTVRQIGPNVVTKQYLDGNFRNSSTSTMELSSYNANNAAFAIGAVGYDTAGADTFFNGKLDDLSIFSSVLSDGGI
jgi:hypothetical protein